MVAEAGSCIPEVVKEEAHHLMWPDQHNLALQQATDVLQYVMQSVKLTLLHAQNGAVAVEEQGDQKAAL